MNENTKKKLLAGAGIAVAAVGVYYAYKQYQASQQTAAASAADQSDAEMQALEMENEQNPYAELYSQGASQVSYDTAGASVAPSVPATTTLAGELSSIEQALGSTGSEAPVTPAPASTTPAPAPAPAPATTAAPPTESPVVYKFGAGCATGGSCAEAELVNGAVVSNMPLGASEIQQVESGVQ